MEEVLHEFPAHRMSKVWWYRVSHQQLLLRGHNGMHKQNSEAWERTDVQFGGVQALHLQTTDFHGGLRLLQLHQPEEHLHRAGLRPGAVKFAKLFALDSDEGRSLIAANLLYVTQDVGPLFGPTSAEREQKERWEQQHSERAD